MCCDCRDCDCVKKYTVCYSSFQGYRYEHYSHMETSKHPIYKTVEYRVCDTKEEALDILREKGNEHCFLGTKCVSRW